MTRGESAAAVGDVVFLSLERWDDVWRRNQYLVAELCRADPTARVLFVEPAADPLHRLSRRSTPRPGRGLRAAPDLDGIASGRVLLHEPTKWLPRRVDPHVDARLARSVERAVARAGLRRPVLWVNDPSGAAVVRRTGWPALYDVTDDWLAADRSPAEHARLVDDEATLLDRCAEVTVCSTGLVARKGTVRDVTLVTNGVDLDRYRAAHERPADLPAGRVALYAGTVHPDRFDVPLLLATARALAGRASVVLVGPVVDLAPHEHAELARAGVVVLGPRPWTTVPAYLRHADVLLVPHVVDAFTDSLDPIKLYEYRAVGRPVVSTPVAGFRDDPQVRVADAGSFPAAVRAALDDAPPPRVARLDDDPPDVPTWRGQAALMRDALRRTRTSRRP
ncbi:glycosyltransferase [Cellulosimicrobium protaetiae]|uniref:Glycosyltransferase n=1 Tax=Cellulosimicrobium protaetiae TaxID=2587808 RepID=A0A6M5UF82_9MICO|nr:glycosyltransferase [Cellulosimicrobium protaetiae]QJW35971.1 glycosyltransferase [Cellulosimicrobium protaetiae]